MKKENKKKFLHSKLFLFAILPLFAIGLIVAAGYVVSTLTLTVGVAEPFTVQYAVLGDGGNYNPTTDGTCANPTGGELVWFDEETNSPPTGPMFPGESRKLCVKIDNAGEAPITYNVTSKIKTGEGNYADCTKAFPETSISGPALSGQTIVGQEFTVPGNAPEVTGCVIEITVARG